MSLLRRHPVAVALAVFAVAVSVARFAVLVDQAPAPATIDSGNWLAFARTLLGDDVRSSSIVYPPLVPLVVLLAVAATNAATGVALVAVASILAAALGTFVALDGRVPRPAAAGASALVIVGSTTGEAAAWGGFPQLLGFGLAMVFLRFLDDALEHGEARWPVVGLSLAALVATSHLIAGAVVLTALVLIALRVLASRGQPRPRIGWRGAAWLVGPSLVLAPVYLRLLIEIAGGLDQRPPFAQLDLSDTPQVLRGIYGDFQVFWVPVLVAMLLTPIALADRWRTPLWRLLVSLLVAAAISTALLHESRFLYFTALPAAVAMGLWCAELRRLRPVAYGVLALAVAVQTVIGLRGFDDHVDFYQVVDRGVYEAIEWVSDNTAHDDLVAVANSNDAPLGWWVEGLARRRALVGSPLRWLTFADEQDRARLANDIFSETFPDDAAFRLAERHGVDYLLVPARWAGGPRGRVRAYARLHPDAVALENPSAIVFRV